MNLLVFMNMKHAHAMRHHSRSLEKMERSYGKFTRHTNKVNIKAVNATTRMFRALTDLAEAEGDNVMKILAEQLFAATKELASVVVRLEELNKSAEILIANAKKNPPKTAEELNILYDEFVFPYNSFDLLRAFFTSLSLSCKRTSSYLEN